MTARPKGINLLFFGAGEGSAPLFFFRGGFNVLRQEPFGALQWQAKRAWWATGRMQQRAGIVYDVARKARALRHLPQAGQEERKRPMKLHRLALLALLTMPVLLFAGETKTTGDTSALRPPKGATVAIIAFEDLQCPDCADAEALLREASAKYNVPIVRRDFPLPMHVWSFEAHVMARYYDAQDNAARRSDKSIPLGEEFRRWVFANQSSINKQNLRGMCERFADQHNMELPENVDPKGELAKLVQADFVFGQQVGIIHTPTVFVVSSSQRGAPFIETLDRDKLFSMIEQLKKTAEAPATGETKR